MATMISCPACKNEISVEATACPKCGQPITDEIQTAGQKKSTKSVKWGRTFLIIILWVAINTSIPSQAVNVPAFSFTAIQFVNNVNKFAKALYNIDDAKKMLIEHSIAISAHISETKDNEILVKINDVGGVLLNTNSKGMVTNIDCLIFNVYNGNRNGLRCFYGMIVVVASIKPDWTQKNDDILVRLKKHFIDNKQRTPMVIDDIVFQIQLVEKDNKTNLLLSMSPAK